MPSKVQEQTRELDTALLHPDRQKKIAKLQKRLAGMPARFRPLYIRAMEGNVSPREAIKAHCQECWGYNIEDTATCDNVACPLWSLRPYQRDAANSPTESVQPSKIDELPEGDTQAGYEDSEIISCVNCPTEATMETLNKTDLI